MATLITGFLPWETATQNRNNRVRDFLSGIWERQKYLLAPPCTNNLLNCCFPFDLGWLFLEEPFVFKMFKVWDGFVVRLKEGELVVFCYLRCSLKFLMLQKREPHLYTCFHFVWKHCCVLLFLWTLSYMSGPTAPIGKQTVSFFFLPISEIHLSYGYPMPCKL